MKALVTLLCFAKSNQTGVEEVQNERGQTNLVIVNFAYSSFPSYVRPPAFLSLLPTLRGISDSIDDAFFLVLDSSAFPVVINQVGLDILPHRNSMAHPPMLPLGPIKDSKDDDGTTESTAASPDYTNSATPHFSSYPLPSHFFGNNYINTWFPAEHRSAAWREYNRLCSGDLGNSSAAHSYTHVLHTNKGIQQATVTDSAIFDPETNALVCTMHLVHIGEIQEDPRISDLAEEINSILSLRE